MSRDARERQRTSRSLRKVEHIERALAQDDPPGGAGFDDVELVHNCLPDISLDEVNLATTAVGLRLPAPLYINAMTGGAPQVTDLNRALAAAAAELGIAMAVGSQRAALEDPELARTYQVVREANPRGTIFANVGADVSPERAAAAVEMIGAAALQVHLNVAQELCMAEGDRDFRHYLENIAAIVERVHVPVIAKEVGFGIARPEARRLRGVGVEAVDVGGKGGTNFALIEAERRGATLSEELRGWGIPTVAALIEVRDIGGLDTLASGGIRSPGDVVKALALGASACGIARPALQAAREGGAAAVARTLRAWIDEMRLLFCLQGARDIDALKRRPVIITGRTGEWLRLRGHDIDFLARRGR